MNHFELLGITPDATTDQVASAYRARAQQLHPDTKPDASAAEKARLTAAMAEVNNAWSTLRDPIKRAEYLEHLNDPAEEPVVMRAPAGDECLMCGSYPAMQVSFQHQRAWLFAASVWTTEARLCRGCGLAIGRSSQNRTLWTGWYGIIAFFRNVGIAFNNTLALYRVGRMTPPRRRKGLVFAPFERAMPPGKPVWQRSGVALVALAIISIGILSAVSESPPPSTPATIGGGTPSNQASWRVGSCVSGSFMVEPVSCSSPNDGLIIARAASSFRCPDWSTGYVEDGDSVWCIG